MIKSKRADRLCFAAVWLLGAPDRQQFQQGCVEATFYVQDQQTAPIPVPPAEVHGGQGIILAAYVSTYVLSVSPGIAELDQAVFIALLLATIYPSVFTSSLHQPFSNVGYRRAHMLCPCVHIGNTLSGELSEPALRLQDDQIAVVVGTITDDVRVYDVAKLRVCALRFTATARARILQVQQQTLHIIHLESFGTRILEPQLGTAFPSCHTSARVRKDRAVLDLLTAKDCFLFCFKFAKRNRFFNALPLCDSIKRCCLEAYLTCCTSGNWGLLTETTIYT